MTLLELDAVDAYYDQSRAIEDISFTVDQGDVLAMFGRNGAGKATTLRSIVGVLHPREGTVRFKDQDVTRLPTLTASTVGSSAASRAVVSASMPVNVFRQAISSASMSSSASSVSPSTRWRMATGASGAEG